MGKMSPESFCYWLQGFMEVQNPEALDCTQTQIIKDHLNEVFDKVTPDRTESKRIKINMDTINTPICAKDNNGPIVYC